MVKTDFSRPIKESSAFCGLVNHGAELQREVSEHADKREQKDVCASELRSRGAERKILLSGGADGPFGYFPITCACNQTPPLLLASPCCLPYCLPLAARLPGLAILTTGM